MQIRFKQITLHNFGSYRHSTIDLTDRGFCLVSGKNNFKQDNASSNGSGKSMPWSAICFTLTGETINGLRTGLKNVYNDEPESYTKLDFSVDTDCYQITRYISPKSDLKIIKNAEDCSGKGIKESEKILSELLPDLTKDLIASTIIIGQAMPNKFSSFSPSGRKDLLEKLTKSDYMIENVKTRLVDRQTELNKQLREYEDSLLVNTTQLTALEKALDNSKNDLANFKELDYQTEIAKHTTIVDKLQKDLDAVVQQKQEFDQSIALLNSDLLTINTQKADELAKLTEAVNAANLEASTKKVSLESEEKYTKQEITKLESIIDVCPTCGRKLDNVVKPDTTELRKKLSILQENLADTNKILQANANKKTAYLEEINGRYAKQIEEVQNKLAVAQKDSAAVAATSTTLTHNVEDEKAIIAKYSFEKENSSKQRLYLQKNIEATEKEISRYTSLISVTTAAKADLQQHLDVLKKLDTLVKRDFRGYLLIDIIKYLDLRAKEYCSLVFGHDDLQVCLNGNNLDIIYCNKSIDALSGGEKQRVDLILQFTLRDMLSTYLGYQSNILVLDEITDFLDKQSCDAVLNLITEKLSQIESVFIISHHATELRIPIDTELIVTKNIEGVSSVLA